MNECEVAGCDRDAITDIPTTDRHGSAACLVVCQVCFNAWRIGRNDPGA